MRLFFSNYSSTLRGTDASQPDDNTILPTEPVLSAAGPGDQSGGGGKREGQDAENRLPGKPPSSSQPEGNAENAGAEPAAASDEAERDAPGLEAKNKNYFKSDTTPDTGIGNV